MDDKPFHRIDPEKLKHITIADIQSGNSFPDQTLDYSIPIPTQNQSIPHTQQDAWLTIEFGQDLTILPDSTSAGRGTIGGC